MIENTGNNIQALGEYLSPPTTFINLALLAVVLIIVSSIMPQELLLIIGVTILLLIILGFVSGSITLLVIGIYFGLWLRLPYDFAAYNIGLGLSLGILAYLRIEKGTILRLSEIKHYFIWISLSIILNNLTTSPVIMLKHLILYAIAPYVIYLIANNFYYDPAWIRKVAYGLLCVFVIESVIVLIQYHTHGAFLTGGIGVIPERMVYYGAKGWSEWFGGDSGINYVVAVAGTFSTANILGQFMDFGAAYTVVLFMAKGSKFLKIPPLMLFVAAVLNTYALILTHSRGSVFGFLLVIIVYSYLNWNVSKSLKTKITIVSLPLFTYVLIKFDFFMLIWSKSSGGGIFGRLIAWSNSLNIFISDPISLIFGMGILDYEKLSSVDRLGAIIGHNAFIAETAVNGLIASLLFLRFLYSWYNDGTKKYIKQLSTINDDEYSPIAIALIASLAGVLLHMLTSSMWGSNMYKMMFFLYLGLISSLIKIKKVQNKTQ